MGGIDKRRSSRSPLTLPQITPKTTLSRLTTLRRQAEFQRIRGGARWATPAFVLAGKARPRAPAGQPTVGDGARFGFTVTRKLGGAVKRNRMRRRLKEAVRLSQREHAADEFDYVLIARSPAIDRPFSELISDLVTAFRRVNRPKSGRITR